MDQYPFLDAAAFAAMFGPLKATETALATPLLEVASNWIWERKPDATQEDSAAMVVVFEVVRDAIWYARREGLTTFSFTTGHRTKSGTADKAVEDFITARHRQMLGLSAAGVGARGRFARNDY